MGKKKKEKIDYYDHEDFRFPLSLLHRAYWILDNYGYKKFRRYVARVDMPMQDVERVLNKHGYRTDPKLKEMIGAKIQIIKDKIGVQITIN